jgi:hypothetical protein
MFTLSSSNPLFVSSLFLALDPLEQFDVLTVPLLGGGVTNLSLLLGLNILIMAV